MPVSTTYEAWDLTSARLPPRSRLYALKPVGIGTPYVESLTSYMARLAEAHGVSTDYLLRRELEPMVKRRLWPEPVTGLEATTCEGPFIYWAELLNGTSPKVSLWVQVLESLTCCRDLGLLTLLPWRNGLPAQGMLRRFRAWCSRCYAQWRQAQQVV